MFPREWFVQTVEMEFEGRMYPVSAFYDEMLTRVYGDYMELPSESERACKVHADIVDLEHSYENYIGIQKHMKIEEYTRSIR